jgi:methylphosphotriester-DNA--protein-cysteine methyltransferase
LAEAAIHARDLRELASLTGYSARQLRRRTVAATGHAPKRLARIGRMQGLLRAGRGESWARTAVEHGFYDEAHMINDITELAGATPHALVGLARYHSVQSPGAASQTEVSGGPAKTDAKCSNPSPSS